MESTTETQNKPVPPSSPTTFKRAGKNGIHVRRGNTLENRIPLEAYLAAVRKSGGLITRAADILQVDSGSVHSARKRWPELEAAVQHEREKRVDAAERMLGKSVDKGESWAVLFTLKCLGRTRGYIEHVGLTTTTNTNTNVEHNVTLDLSKLTKEELEVLRVILKRAESVDVTPNITTSRVCDGKMLPA